jgi:hypothetical protein
MREDKGGPAEPAIIEGLVFDFDAAVTGIRTSKFGVTLGKFNLLDVGGTEFYGDYRTQFMNTAFNFPMTLALLPLSTFGVGAAVLPRDDIQLSALVLGPNGELISNHVGQAFHGVLILGNAKLTVKPFGLVGHQSLGFTWNALPAQSGGLAPDARARRGHRPLSREPHAAAAAPNGHRRGNEDIARDTRPRSIHPICCAGRQ